MARVSDFLKNDIDGLDSTLLDYNLGLTPEQRLQEHQKALDMLLKLEEAGRKHYAESEQSSGAFAQK